ncbi:Lysine-specific demethylase 3B [Hypsibius exemplaris]|uniref:Lysine-specific demethylase 3B n=1 Tax=Hypsibius exemplaris TaxID=2072580 RepID=A0A1W0W8H5_HYPEX|nr:Lysine-specific demethylase 3B [Hypsibius exemplaris]
MTSMCYPVTPKTSYRRSGQKRPRDDVCVVPPSPAEASSPESANGSQQSSVIVFAHKRPRTDVGTICSPIARPRPAVPTEMEFVQEGSCLDLHYREVALVDPGQHLIKLHQLPMCSDCYLLKNKPGPPNTIVKHTKATSCRFQGAFLRRLVLDERAARRTLKVHSLICEADKLDRKRMLDLSLFTDAYPKDVARLPQQDRLYILRKILPTLRGVSEQELSHIQCYDDAQVSMKTTLEGFREFCDVCQTSIFDIHWTCLDCAFAACVDCKSDRQLIIDMSKNCDLKLHFRKVPMTMDRLPRDGMNWPACCANTAQPLPKAAARFADEARKARDPPYPHNLVPTRIVPSQILKKLVEDAQGILDKTGEQNPVPLPVSVESASCTPVLLCGGRLLWMQQDMPCDSPPFREHWDKGLPVLVSRILDQLGDKQLWLPSTFCKMFGEDPVSLVDCSTNPHTDYRNKRHIDFWPGFENRNARGLNDEKQKAVWKIKDWPVRGAFAEILPKHFEDLMQALPLNRYTNVDGDFNLAKYLPGWLCRPDLGPKMYAAYSSSTHPESATTNLHVDISDAINVIVYVGRPFGEGAKETVKAVSDALEKLNLDTVVLTRLRLGETPGALWQIYRPEDSSEIKKFLLKVRRERGIEGDEDPVHCQTEYLTVDLRKRLFLEHNVVGMDIVQFEGDGIFIPASAPHQVWNLYSCVKVAEDFVTPEHVHDCALLTKEFRQLPNDFSNKADKLQIKNILFHTVKSLVRSFDADHLA